MEMGNGIWEMDIYRPSFTLRVSPKNRTRTLGTCDVFIVRDNMIPPLKSHFLPTRSSKLLPCLLYKACRSFCTRTLEISLKF